jgi:hypothetical protein
MTARRLVSFIVPTLFVGLSACEGADAQDPDVNVGDESNEEDDCEVGTETCACASRSRCDEGLECRSGLCVSADPDEDDGEGEPEPEPSEEPEPEDAEPEDAGPTDEPEPVDEGEPEPAASEPSETEAEPEPTEQGPEPAEAEPEPVEPQPEPAEQEPEPAQPEPAEPEPVEPEPMMEPVPQPDVPAEPEAEVSDPSIIDNFSSCDGLISVVAGRDGFWYGFGDNDVNVSPNFAGGALTNSTPPSGFSAAPCAAWITGGCTEGALACSFAGIGFTLQASEAGYDLSEYSGFTFDYEGDDIFVIVNLTQGRSFGVNVAASSGARAPRTVTFASLDATANNPSGAVLDLTQVTKIEFTTTAPQGFGQAIYNVTLF